MAASDRGLPIPWVVSITDLTKVPARETLDRIEALEPLSAELRARTAILLRDPELEGGPLFDWGRQLRARTSRVGVELWVADRLDLTVALGADAVHLGRRSVGIADARALVGPERRISVACHSVEEVLAQACDGGADVTLLSPIFVSPGKGEPLGAGAIRQARQALSMAARAPELIALGGIDRARVAPCLEAGASGVAAIRAPAASLRGG
jgi:thiamine-phosphate pyrophosphorylase